MLVLAPVAIILVTGLSLGNIYGVNPGPRVYVVPIVDADHGAVAHAIISALQREPAITLLMVRDVGSARAVVLRQRRSPLAIAIPSGTTRALETGSKSQLVLYIDPVKRIEVSAIDLRLDKLFREITAHAQNGRTSRGGAAGCGSERGFDNSTNCCVVGGTGKSRRRCDFRGVRAGRHLQGGEAARVGSGSL